MLKTLVKIAVALVVLHGAFRIGNAYWTFYRFEDALQDLAQFGERKTTAQMCDQAMDIAAGLGVPIAAAGLTIRRGTDPPYNCQDGQVAAEPGAAAQASAQMSISGSYVDRVQVLPGYFYPWQFAPGVKAWLRP